MACDGRPDGWWSCYSLIPGFHGSNAESPTANTPFTAPVPRLIHNKAFWKVVDSFVLAVDFSGAEPNVLLTDSFHTGTKEST